MKKIIIATLVSTVMVSGAAYAQTAKKSSPAITTAHISSDAKMSLKGQWRASKLIGLNVYNNANEKLGDINELILDKSGKINAIVIGVGGFLGMGEHDIAVSMDKLQFVESPVKTSSASPTTSSRETTTGAAVRTSPSNTTNAHSADLNDWTPDHAVMSADKEQA